VQESGVQTKQTNYNSDLAARGRGWWPRFLHQAFWRHVDDVALLALAIAVWIGSTNQQTIPRAVPRRDFLLLRPPSRAIETAARSVASDALANAEAGSYPVRAGDVVTRVGSAAVDNEGMVDFGDNLMLPFTALIPSKTRSLGLPWWISG
jgi:hypothetical protein